jgi:hypothetical protein
MVEDRDVDEPLPLCVPDEPLYRGCGLNDGESNRSQTSDLLAPLEEKPYELEL